ncbi:uncharacterized protein LOC144247094 [Lonchura striata]
MVNLHQDYASWQARDEAKRKRKEDEREKEVLQREKAIQRYIERILQMDEDEFNALPEEKKAELDKMLVEKKCIQRVRELKWLAQKLEEEAKALEEELRQKEEERRKEEERQKKEKKGVSVGKQPPQPDKGQTKPPEKMGTKAPEGKETKLSNKKETEPSEMEESKIPEMKETKSPERKETKSPEEEEIKAPEKKETKILEMKRDKIPEKLKYKAPEKGEPKAPEKGETEIPEDPSQMENLILRFQIYESSQQNVAEVLSCWDRVQGTMQLPVIQKENKSQSSAGNKGQKTNKPQEKLEKPEQRSGDQRSRQSSQQEMQSEVAEGAVRDEHIGVPCLDIQVSDPKAMIREILRDGKLPTEDEVTPCKAQILSLSWSWALEHCVIMAQSLVQASDDVPQWLCTICVDGEVITIPQMGRKCECSVYKCPICSEFPSLEIINGPRTGQLTAIVFFS